MSPGSARVAVTKSRNKFTAMSLDIRNFGCSDKERRMFPTDPYDFYWQQLSDKSGSWWRNIRSFWGSSLNLCTNLWVGGLNWKGLNTIPRLLYLQTSPSDPFITWWIPTAGLLHDEYFANITRREVARGVQLTLRLTVYSVHTSWELWRSGYN
jgi:hypothetical protein